ncbi:fimbrial protein [Janthinobacterium sp. GMG1]|uniref:fimbrial protein n=1 Tax=Janthinobacterium sp. GMG1 TaxID=3096007 RepID=UPI002ACABF81|nr:fimbrial protein [Janthinobacterium sp. GMG1]MDZ5633864.1 fimbrial protein [Janthinobacterium sp. GMG1]
MHIGSLLKSGLAVALLWALTGSAFAVTCTYLDGIRPAVGAMPLQVSALSVGRDVPVGTEVYRQTFKMASGQAVKLECLYAPYQQHTEFEVDSNYGLANWIGAKSPNKVYQTGIPGLGVFFNSTGGLLPRETNKISTSCTPGWRCLVPFDGPSNFELILIKVGEVTPGVLRGDSLPTVSLYGNFGDARMLGFKMGLSGNIQIVSRTCSTPDVIVPMGTHTSKTFTGLNSTPGWTNFSIRLNNCPAFHGTVSKTPVAWVSQSGNSPSGTAGNVSIDKNSLRYRIDPVRTAINSDTGVLSLDPTAANRPPAASGIGVQIAFMTGTQPFSLAAWQSSGLTLSSSEISYDIPLRARYLQTASAVKGGAANASATFTISYD